MTLDSVILLSQSRGKDLLIERSSLPWSNLIVRNSHESGKINFLKEAESLSSQDSYPARLFSWSPRDCFQRNFIYIRWSLFTSAFLPSPVPRLEITLQLLKPWSRFLSVPVDGSDCLVFLEGPLKHDSHAAIFLFLLGMLISYIPISSINLLIFSSFGQTFRRRLRRRNFSSLHYNFKSFACLKNIIYKEIPFYFLFWKFYELILFVVLLQAEFLMKKSKITYTGILVFNLKGMLVKVSCKIKPDKIPTQTWGSE